MKEINRQHKFDKTSCRHSLMGFQTVLHCHHYLTLTTQMAEDSEEMVGGVSILISTMEETIYKVLKKYFLDNKIKTLDDKIALIESYFSFCGLGQMKIKHFGDYSTTAELLHSHIDEGWIQKWGKRDKPVGYVNRGFLQGALKAVNEFEWESQEDRCIVSGDKISNIKLWRK